jgi:hypothetical protein
LVALGLFCNLWGIPLYPAIANIVLTVMTGQIDERKETKESVGNSMESLESGILEELEKNTS